MNVHRRSFLRLAAMLTPCSIVAVLPACAIDSPAPTAAAKAALAPSGTLRVGLYPGTPTSIIGDPASADARGVGLNLGSALARRAGVAFEAVVFKNNAEVFTAARTGTVDAVFTNATPARMNDLDFSPTVLQVEQGYLVPAGSTIRATADIDRPGVRVGVSEGSTSEATLSREFRNATIVRTASLSAAIDLLATTRLDAFATNKATLFEMADKLPGSSVLPGRWGLESFAIGIPKGRTAAMPVLRGFVVDAKANGLVRRAVERAGLRGAVFPD